MRHFVLLVAAIPVCLSAQPNARTLAEQFRRRLQARADVLVSGDTAPLGRPRASWLTMIDEKGARGGADSLRKRFLPLPPAVHYHEVVDDVQVDTAGLGGGVAVVTYRTTMFLVFQGEPVTKALRVTEVFRRPRRMRANDAWETVAYHETAVPGAPIPTGGDTALYRAYVGRYELTPGVVYRVRRDSIDGKLLWGNRILHELVPEGADTFVISGDQYRVVFIRDATGRVTHLRIREFPGVEYNAIRVGG